MDDEASNPVYAKTARGRAEMEARTRSLHGAQRTALILVDGRSPLSALADKLGPPAAALVAELLSAGYVERVDPQTRPVRRSIAAEVPSPAVTTLPGPLPDDLQRRQRLAVEVLAPHFGPDVAIVCQPLTQAASHEAFERGLDGIERKLAIYMGKGGAARAVASLRGR